MPGVPAVAQVFVGAAITATSVGITARPLKDLGASRSAEARIILGAAVVDDVLALVVLGAVTAWVGQAQGAAAPAPASVLALVMKTPGFLVLAIMLGARLTPAWFRYAAKLQTRGALLAVGLCFCFLLSSAASAIGLAPLVGAFAAGLVLEDMHSELFVQRGEPSLSDFSSPWCRFWSLCSLFSWVFVRGSRSWRIRPFSCCLWSSRLLPLPESCRARRAC
jgi:Kef-type K+ transport system membrane component KefB